MPECLVLLAGNQIVRQASVLKEYPRDDSLAWVSGMLRHRQEPTIHHCTFEYDNEFDLINPLL